MKKFFISLLALSTVVIYFGCKKKEEPKKLYAIWYQVAGGPVTITYSDSLESGITIGGSPNYVNASPYWRTGMKMKAGQTATLTIQRPAGFFSFAIMRDSTVLKMDTINPTSPANATKSISYTFQ